jgi:hypothetical protein
MINGSVTRLLFHVVSDSATKEHPREKRTLAFKLVLPTHAILDSLIKTLQSFAANKDQLTAAVDLQRAAIVQMLNGINTEGVQK